jgi:misshapen/NIK-related kinase
MKDMLDRMKKHKAAQKEREEMQYPYSGSDEDQPETNVAGEPSSILQAPGENTLRKNFQVLQEHKAAQQAAQQAAAANNGRGQMPIAAAPQAQPPDRKDRRSSRKEEVPEPGKVHSSTFTILSN